jgi:hypothetical protein
MSNAPAQATYAVLASSMPHAGEELLGRRSGPAPYARFEAGDPYTRVFAPPDDDVGRTS